MTELCVSAVYNAILDGSMSFGIFQVHKSMRLLMYHVHMLTYQVYFRCVAFSDYYHLKMLKSCEVFTISHQEKHQEMTSQYIKYRDSSACIEVHVCCYVALSLGVGRTRDTWPRGVLKENEIMLFISGVLHLELCH